ncbi:MAG: PKD domain-containing protein [Candidatus Vogelbacteria bacterium]|nr:PKD domain-containing protein [Candidatus Vogelbacteria bacterium]
MKINIFLIAGALALAFVLSPVSPLGGPAITHAQTTLLQQINTGLDAFTNHHSDNPTYVLQNQILRLLIQILALGGGSGGTPPPTPAITVVSPNGGESWFKDGQTNQISWIQKNIPSDINIEIVFRYFPDDNPFSKIFYDNLEINSSSDFGGKASISLSNTPGCLTGDIWSRTSGKFCFPPGVYTLKVKANEGNIVAEDWSDSYFKIYDSSQPPAPVADLKVNGSDGPVNIKEGESTLVSWTVSSDIKPSCNITSTFGWGVSMAGSGSWQTPPINYAGQSSGVVYLKCSTSVGSLADEVKLLKSDQPTNRPPSISGVSGPTTLEVGKSGTWSVTASDPENGPLSYSVVWGDAGGTTAGSPVQQTATFTHTYSQAGTYYPTFTVTDNAGQSAKTSLSVVVQGGTTIGTIKVDSPQYGQSVPIGSEFKIAWSESIPSALGQTYILWTTNGRYAYEIGKVAVPSTSFLWRAGNYQFGVLPAETYDIYIERRDSSGTGLYAKGQSDKFSLVDNVLPPIATGGVRVWVQWTEGYITNRINNATVLLYDASTGQAIKKSLTAPYGNNNVPSAYFGDLKPGKYYVKTSAAGYTDGAYPIFTVESGKDSYISVEVKPVLTSLSSQNQLANSLSALNSLLQTFQQSLGR